MRLDPNDVCAIIVTRGDVDLDVILETVAIYGEVLVRHPTYTYRLGAFRYQRWEHEDRAILGRYLAQEYTKKPVIYYQDDDIIFTEHEALMAAYEPGKLIANMGEDWIHAQSYYDLALVGLGSLIDRDVSMPHILRYIAAFPDDKRYCIDADFAHGVLVPHKKVDLGAEVLPVASADNRLWRQPEQFEGKWQTIRQARTLRTVCLTMLTKNEQENVRTALDSAKGLFDRALIIDTGSTDYTVREAIAWGHENKVKVEVIERPWVNMEHNRNELLVEGRTRGDFMLLMDADETFIEKPSSWPPLVAHGFFLHYAGEMDYSQPRLIYRDFPWYFEGRSHAALACDQEAVMLDLTAPLVEHHGWDRSGPTKWQKDVELLSQDIIEGVDVPRSLFMRGKAHEGLGHTEEAIADYTARLALADESNAEETYYTQFRLGVVLTEHKNEFLEGLDNLIMAWANRPWRAESLRAAASYITAVADSIPYPADDKIIVHRDCYTNKEGHHE